MSLQGKFKQKLYKEDLVPVIKQGTFVAFVGGLLIGGLTLLLLSITQFSLYWIFYFIMVQYLTRRIRGAYFQYHIWYSIISVIALLFAIYLGNVVAYGGLIFTNNITDLSLYLQVLNPLQYFSFLNPFTWFGSSIAFLNSIVDLLLFGFLCYYAFKHVE